MKTYSPPPYNQINLAAQLYGLSAETVMSQYAGICARLNKWDSERFWWWFKNERERHAGTNVGALLADTYPHEFASEVAAA